MQTKSMHINVTKAYDLYRTRKVKCKDSRVQIEANLACKACLKEGLQCTYHIPVSKRGPPPKRQAQASLSQHYTLSSQQRLTKAQDAVPQGLHPNSAIAPRPRVSCLMSKGARTNGLPRKPRRQLYPGVVNCHETYERRHLQPRCRQALRFRTFTRCQLCTLFVLKSFWMRRCRTT